MNAPALSIDMTNWYRTETPLLLAWIEVCLHENINVEKTIASHLGRQLKRTFKNQQIHDRLRRIWKTYRRSDWEKSSGETWKHVMRKGMSCLPNLTSELVEDIHKLQHEYKAELQREETAFSGYLSNMEDCIPLDGDPELASRQSVSELRRHF
jgi:hypothetical protein